MPVVPGGRKHGRLQHDGFRAPTPRPRSNRSSSTIDSDPVQEGNSTAASTTQLSHGAVLCELRETLGDLFTEFAEIYEGFQHGILGREAFEALASEILPSNKAQLILDLTRQNRGSESNELPCTLCGKVLKSDKALRNHMRGKHNSAIAQQQTLPGPPLVQPCLQSAPQKQRVHKSPKRSKLGIVWHKWSDLRLRDHEPACQAHQECDAVLHIHVVEDGLLAGRARCSGMPRCSPQRKAFWRQCVVDLAVQLEGIAGQDLIIVRAADVPVFFQEMLREVLHDGSTAASAGPNTTHPSRWYSVVVYSHREFCSEETALS